MKFSLPVRRNSPIVKPVEAKTLKSYSPYPPLFPERPKQVFPGLKTPLVAELIPLMPIASDLGVAAEKQMHREYEFVPERTG